MNGGGRSDSGRRKVDEEKMGKGKEDEKKREEWRVEREE